MGLFNFGKKKKGFDLNRVLELENKTKAIIEFDIRLNELSEYGEQIDRLTKYQKVFLFVENLEREVNNGGFNQFYFNSSGDFAHETENGLKAIHAGKMADIAARANSVWPEGLVPTNRTKRQEVLLEIEGKCNHGWEKCDNEFYQYPNDLESLLLEYVRKHQVNFE